jgi:repressor LexA
MTGKRKSKDLSPRQEKMLLFIEDCLANHHPPSIREICESCDISSTSVADYNLKRLEELGYISRKDNVSRGIQVLRPIGTKLLDDSKVQVPLVGEIAAGKPMSVPDNDTVAENYIEIARDLIRVTPKRGLFALRVKGHSMIDALVDDGDIVVISPQETADNGNMVAAQIRDSSEWTLKRFYKKGDKIVLQPANSGMFSEEDVRTKFTFPATDVTIAGRVCLVLRQF